MLSVVAITPAGFWCRPLAAGDGRAVKAGRRLAFLLPALLAPRRVGDAVLRGALGGSGSVGYRDAPAERIPVHVVWATLDRMVGPPRASPPAAVRVHTLRGAGHLPMVERPAAVAALLLATACQVPAGT